MLRTTSWSVAATPAIAIAIAITAVIVVSALTPPTAEANPFYLIGKLGSSSISSSALDDRFQQVLDGDDNTFSAGLGFRFGKYLAFQGEYYDLGKVPGFGGPCRVDEFCISLPIEAETEATTVTVLGNWPLFRKRLYVYLKAGVVAWSADIEAAIDKAELFFQEVDNEDYVAAAGIRFNFIGPFDAFAEYEQFGGLFDIVNVGVTIGF